ncbi:CocE/NonD family hydrolase [Mycobacterium sp. B14F4]|uniref:CocE/NonD family hydrolase n=1 Tax=Mycobacterium sp. B14F4 TaxID=3153565 RepID=UPI00325E15A4
MTELRQHTDAGRVSRLQRLGDVALSRLLRLPPVRTEYTVRRGLRVPMRDGVELLADHYAPDTDRPAGTILMRSPYGRGMLSSLLFGQLYASRGYHIVVQSVRGTFGSGGTLSPMTYEKDDGLDTAAWLRGQPWYTGGFAMLGVSYGAMAGWALMDDPPPDVTAVIAIVGPHDASRISWDTGAFALADTLGWSHQVAYQEKVGRWQKLLAVSRTNDALDSALSEFPLGDAARKLLGDSAPWYREWIEHRDKADPYWTPTRFDGALEKITVPVLLITGWQDAFLTQTLDQYTRLRERGVNVALTVGSWSHLSMLTTAIGDVSLETLNWLDRHVAGRAGTSVRSPVRASITNDTWVELPHWPPQTEDQYWYLGCGGSLVSFESGYSGAASKFRFDPGSPTPAPGGPFLSSAGGYQDDTDLARRDDVLSFITEPLPADVYLMGSPTVDLIHSADNPHADVFVRVSEVNSRGKSRNVTDGFRRLTASAAAAPVRIELDSVAHRFRIGSRIRLVIAGGAHPRFSRNTGTAESPWDAERFTAVTHTVHHGEGLHSRLTMPTTDGRPSSTAVS